MTSTVLYTAKHELTKQSRQKNDQSKVVMGRNTWEITEIMGVKL